MIDTKKYTYTSPNFVEFGKSRCLSVRRQRFIPLEWLNQMEEFLNRIEGESSKIYANIEEYIWVKFEGKNKWMFVKLKNGKYVYISYVNGDVLPYIDYDYRKIVSDKMTNEDYYYYRNETELLRQIQFERLNEFRKPKNDSKDDKVFEFILDKIGKKDFEYTSFYVDKLDYHKMFDHLVDVKKFYWISLNINSNQTSYILCKGRRDFYLIKFDFFVNITLTEMKNFRVYISETYQNLVSKCLNTKEYEKYMTETLLDQDDQSINSITESSESIAEEEKKEEEVFEINEEVNMNDDERKIKMFKTYYGQTRGQMVTVKNFSSSDKTLAYQGVDDKANFILLHLNGEDNGKRNIVVFENSENRLVGYTFDLIQQCTRDFSCITVMSNIIEYTADDIDTLIRGISETEPDMNLDYE